MTDYARAFRDWLIEENVGLAYKIAHACWRRHRWMDREELRAEALRGLTVAGRTFDLSRGVCFSTHAWQWAGGYARNAVRNEISRRRRQPPHVPLREDWHVERKAGAGDGAGGEWPDAAEAVARYLALATPGEREALVAIYLRGERPTDAAARRGVHPNCVSQLATNGVRRIRRKIGIPVGGRRARSDNGGSDRVQDNGGCNAS